MRPALLTVSLLFTFSLFFFHPLPPVLSEQAGGGEVLTDPDAIRAFADSLFYRGLLFRAAMEYQRFVYLYPSHSDTPGVLFNLATAAKLAGDHQSARNQLQEQEKSLLGFADYLFEEGHYYQAVTEYGRFIYFNPGHPSVPRARLKTARCYKMGGQYDKAIGLYRELAAVYAGREEGIEAAFQAGDCFRLSEDYEEALRAFSRFIEESPSHPLADKARWNMAWTYVWLQDYGSARKELLHLNESSLYQASSRELMGALGEIPYVPRKSPFLSGMLAALVPGAGHLYTGQKKQALFSFVTNALLIFGSYEAFSKELYTAGGFLSLFSINYYSGNIFGAITSAHKFNRRSREEHLEQLMKKYDNQADGFPGE